MTTLYLIRHAEAEGNLYERMHGQYNSLLTQLGRAQVQALQTRFADVPIDAVYSSDLYRTMETAAALYQPRHLPLHTDPRLREIDVGPWEDLPFGQVQHDEPDAFFQFAKDVTHWRLPGAECYDQVANRMAAALTEIATKNDGKTVAVVSHGFAIRATLSKLVYSPDRLQDAGIATNTSVTRLRYAAGRFSMDFQNDASHLDALHLRRSRWQPSPDTPPNLWYAPLGREIEQYIKYRDDAWQVVYGDAPGFDGPAFWLDAQRTMGPDPNAMVVAYLQNDPVGMIQLSPDREEKKGIGYIPFLYLREPYRRKDLGIQLIGHAVMFYRKLGRTKLQLSVAPGNEPALGFYRKYGFAQTGKTKGRFGKLLLMEKDIAPPPAVR